MKSYLDKWTCPNGHQNATIRRTSSAGRVVSTTCTHRACNWTKYKVQAGPAPSTQQAHSTATEGADQREGEA